MRPRDRAVPRMQGRGRERPLDILPSFLFGVRVSEMGFASKGQESLRYRSILPVPRVGGVSSGLVATRVGAEPRVSHEGGRAATLHWPHRSPWAAGSDGVGGR